MADAREQFGELIGEYRANHIDRRQFLARAGAMGLSAAAAGALLGVRPAGAQDATPAATPAAGGEVQTSISREEAEAILYEAYPLDPEAQPGGVYIHGDATDITTTNGMLGDNAPTNDIIIGPIFETLAGNSPVTGEYIPGLADRWEISADGLEYTFFLNQTVTWHDGEQLTADDVIMSFDAQSDPATTSAYTGSFTQYVGSYEAVDDYTVRVTPTDVYAPIGFFGNFYCPIMAEHIWGSVPHAEWAADPGSNGQDPSRVVGTGPFLFQEWNLGESATLNANESYWDGGRPNPDQFIFRVYPEDVASIEAIRAGEIDSIWRIAASDVEPLESEGITVKVYDTLSFGFYGYQLNPERSPLFQDIPTRQALFYALDRQSIVDNIQLGYGEVAQGTQPVLSPAYAPDQINTVYNFDPELANQLLDEAGWVLGDDGVRERDGVRFEFDMIYGASTQNVQTAAYMQEAWAAVGVAMQPTNVDFSTVLVPAITETFDFTMAFLGFSWDPTGDQSAMFSTSAQDGNGFNFMDYTNEEYDRLAAEANRELDPERRRELLIEATNIVNDELPVGIISFTRDRTAVAEERIRNFQPNGYGLFWSLNKHLWVAQQ